MWKGYLIGFIPKYLILFSSFLSLGWGKRIALPSLYSSPSPSSLTHSINLSQVSLYQESCLMWFLQDLLSLEA
jgi:hypothetical protein